MKKTFGHYPYTLIYCITGPESCSFNYHLSFTETFIVSVRHVVEFLFLFVASHPFNISPSFLHIWATGIYEKCYSSRARNKHIIFACIWESLCSSGELRFRILETEVCGITFTNTSVSTLWSDSVGAFVLFQIKFSITQNTWQNRLRSFVTLVQILRLTNRAS